VWLAASDCCCALWLWVVLVAVACVVALALAVAVAVAVAVTVLLRRGASRLTGKVDNTHGDICKEIHTRKESGEPDVDEMRGLLGKLAENTGDKEGLEEAKGAVSEAVVRAVDEQINEVSDKGTLDALKKNRAGTAPAGKADHLLERGHEIGSDLLQ